MITEQISRMQEDLASGRIQINAPCGAEPIIEILGGIHARASIWETRGTYSDQEEEFALVEKLVALLSS